MGFFGGLATTARSVWPSWFGKDRTLKLFAEQNGGYEGGGTATAGQPVNINSAMTYSAVWSAVSVIAQNIASLPCVTYKRMPDGRRERQDSAPTAWLLHEEPNPYQTPFVFMETALHHVLITGNFFAEIQKDGANKPARLWLVDPCDVTPFYDAQHRLRYKYKGTDAWDASEVIHVPGLGWDGLKGYSVVNKARQAISLGIATDKFGGAFFGNGAWPGIALEHPKTVSQPAQDRLIAGVERRHQGADKAFRPFVAEEGMVVKTLSIPNDDAQFLETRQFQIEEIARWFNIPLTKLKSKAGERPGGNIEAQNIEFVVDCLRPWLVRIEQEFNRKLIPLAARPNTYVEFNVSALLRGDSGSRANSYRAYFDMGVLDAETIAALENLPKPKPKKEPEPPPVVVAVPAPKDEPAKDEEKQAARAALRCMILDAVRWLARHEANEARRAAGSGKLANWRPDFYGKHRARLVAAIEPAFRLVSPLAGDSRVKSELLVGRLTARHEEELSRSADVEALCGRWEVETPAEVADEILGGR